MAQDILRGGSRLRGGRAGGARSRGIWRQVWRNRWPYLFIAPFFVLFAVFGLFPPVFSFYLSFHNWDVLTEPHYVGLANYVHVLRDSLLVKAFGNVFALMLLATVPMLVLALVVAYLLDGYIRRARNGFLVAYFSPAVTSSVASVIIFGLLYGFNYGLINAGLRALGVAPVRWLTDPLPMKISLAILLIWRWLGWNVVLYLAGLQAISHTYYEAARVDGANGAQVLLYVTLPLMRPTILYTTVISVSGMLQLFAEPYLLSVSVPAGYLSSPGLGGRANSLLTVVMYLYDHGFRNLRFGYASAIAYVDFVVILALTILNLRITRQEE